MAATGSRVPLAGRTPLDPFFRKAPEPNFSAGQALGEVQYRRVTVLAAEWRLPGTETALDLNQFYAVGAPLGGPVALAPVALLRTGHPQQRTGTGERNGSATGDAILIFSCAGTCHGRVAWSGRPPVLSLGWSRAEALVCACGDGAVLCFSLRGVALASVSLFGEAAPDRLADALVWEGGVVGLSADESRVYVLEEPEAQAEPSGTQRSRAYTFPSGLGATAAHTPLRQVTCLCVMQSREADLRVLLATRNRSLVVTSEAGFQDQELQAKVAGRITRLAVAPNHRFVACYRDDGFLTVLSANFESRVLDFDLNTQSPPLDMVWCGEDSIVLHWRGFLLMVGPYGDSLRYRYKEASGAEVPLKLVPEFDCCRILTADSAALLQRIPTATETVRRIGSTDPAAMLYDAMERFEAGDPGADENIRGLEDPAALTDAVKCCVDAALGEFAAPNQKALLRAAAYGKNFCADFDPDELVSACRQLRVLHQLRQPWVGMPLTAAEYDRATPAVILHRLAARHLHAVALEAADLLELSDAKAGVLLHWACEKVRSDASLALSDEELAALIAQRLGLARGASRHNNGLPQVGYCAPPAAQKLRTPIAEVAAAASASGRRSLAVRLLELEPLASERVPLLLNLEEHAQALEAAVGAGDGDLILLCLLFAERRVAPAAVQERLRGAEGAAPAAGSEAQRRFQDLVLAYPEATRLLKALYKQRIAAGAERRAADQRALVGLCRYQGGFAAEAEAAESLVKEAVAAPASEEKLSKLRLAQGLYRRSRENAFLSRATEEAADLLAQQMALERRLPDGESLVHRSLTDTIKRLIALAGSSSGRGRSVTPEWCQTEALNLAKKFGVSEKRVWRIRIQAMGSSGQWEQLQRLASGRGRPPVGFAPFAQAALDHRRPSDEIFHYIDKVQDLEKRFDLLATAGSQSVTGAWLRAFEVASQLRDPRRLQAVRLQCSDPGLISLVDDRLSKM